MSQRARDKAKSETDGLRVLLVDDHDLFRTGLRNLLEEQGVNVIGEAPNGQTAIRLASDLAPDVIVMDLNMPGLTGVETTRQLAGIAPLVACSPSTLRRTLRTMVDALGDWGDATGKALGDAVRVGPERLLSLALDETWKRSMILVAMDVASGFILAEAHATARDAATWSATMTKALGALPVKVVQAVELPELAHDPRFATTRERAANQVALKDILETRFRTASASHWLAVFAAAGVPHAPINDYAAALADPQVEHMSWVQSLTLPNGIVTRTFGTPVRIDGAAAPIGSPPPALGQHTAEIRARYAARRGEHT